MKEVVLTHSRNGACGNMITSSVDLEGLKGKVVDPGVPCDGLI